ncbi:MAG TPA: hypothetical protein VMH22_01630 [bacterium]|nr:hypothetical protein [bacterium]
MRIVLLVLVACLSASGVLYNIDQPVPISLAHAEYYIGGRVWGSGGIMMRVALGLFDRVTLGMSYGGDSILGAGKPKFFDRYRPDVQARIAVLQEQGYVPNLVLGFESQGYDDCDSQKYSVREKGGYLCVGKTLDVIDTHCQLGVNYWGGFDGFLALNALLPGSAELMLEYDPAFNDHDKALRHRGFLNFGIEWTVADRVRMVVGLRDILGNLPTTRLNRVLDVSLNNHF